MYDIPTSGDITIYQCPTNDITIMNQSTTNVGKCNFFLCESQGKSQVWEGLPVTVPDENMEMGHNIKGKLGNNSFKVCQNSNEMTN